MSPSSAMPPCLCFWGWVYRSCQKAAQDFHWHTCGGVWHGWPHSPPTVSLSPWCPHGISPPIAHPSPRLWLLKHQDCCHGLSLRAPAAAAPAAPAGEREISAPKHSHESGTAFPPVFGWSGTSRDRRRLCRLPGTAEPGAGSPAPASRGVCPRHRCMKPAGICGFLGGWQGSVLCSVCPGVPEANSACGCPPKPHAKQGAGTGAGGDGAAHNEGAAKVLVLPSVGTTEVSVPLGTS